jgi:hypothetical protein
LRDYHAAKPARKRNFPPRLGPEATVCGLELAVTIVINAETTLAIR